MNMQLSVTEQGILLTLNTHIDLSSHKSQRESNQHAVAACGAFMEHRRAALSLAQTFLRGAFSPHGNAVAR